MYDLLSSFTQWITVLAGTRLARYREVTSPSFANVYYVVSSDKATPRDWS